MMRCVVIDDEPLAREGMVNYISNVDFLDLVGTAENALELMKLIELKHVDLLFLDIHMPLMSGIEYLKSTKNRPMVIFTTAYPNYAIEGFELDVLDYLLKPITFNRFFKAVTKARDYQGLQENFTSPHDIDLKEPYFFVKCNQIYQRILFDHILFVEAQENYVVIHTKEQKYMVLMPIKRIEELLGEGFLRVHKSWIVALDKVSSLERDRLSIASQMIPISRNYRSKVIECVVGDKLWKK